MQIVCCVCGCAHTGACLGPGATGGTTPVSRAHLAHWLALPVPAIGGTSPHRPKLRIPDLSAGMVWMHADFNAPLSDEEW